MKVQLEIPDDWVKEGKEWHSHQLLSCNQCPYKTPVAALYVMHVYTEHTKLEDVTLTTAK